MVRGLYCRVLRERRWWYEMKRFEATNSRKRYTGLIGGTSGYKAGCGATWATWAARAGSSQQMSATAARRSGFSRCLVLVDTRAHRRVRSLSRGVGFRLTKPDVAPGAPTHGFNIYINQHVAHLVLH
jgi:hypothetical protein